MKKERNKPARPEPMCLELNGVAYLADNTRSGLKALSMQTGIPLKDLEYGRDCLDQRRERRKELGEN